MYKEGTPAYKDHLARFGHPSKHGFKDVIKTWNADAWNPDRLISLYQQAGVKYLVCIGSHHDNFFLWKSKMQRWNSVVAGPHRDIVGEWQQAAKKHGLRFGVSEHVSRAMGYYGLKSDQSGPLAGIPYDTMDPANQDLYHTLGVSPSEWEHYCFDFMKEIVELYHPDFLSSDGGVPKGMGYSMLANYYNDNIRQHGALEAVYTGKDNDAGEKPAGMCVEAVECGVKGAISPQPWQTEATIGAWFDCGPMEYHHADFIVPLLADVVSKNGNLLINFVMRLDGTLAPGVEDIVKDVGAWNTINGEAIFGSRPWTNFGEGPEKAKRSHMKKYSYGNFKPTAKDIRFTTKGGSLYAIVLGWPEDGKVAIRSLARTKQPGGNAITTVELLGHAGTLTYEQTAEALVVNLPGQKPCKYAVTLKIAGQHLEAVPFEEVSNERAAEVAPDAKGDFLLTAAAANMRGGDFARPGSPGNEEIQSWVNPEDFLDWTALIPLTGTYQIRLDYAAAQGSSGFDLEMSGQKLAKRVEATSTWSDFTVVDLGRVDFSVAGPQTIVLRPHERDWRPINLRSLKLTKVQ
jgi:alpha-L-fucosidase